MKFFFDDLYRHQLETVLLCQIPVVSKIKAIEQLNNDGHHIAEIRALNKSIKKIFTEKKRTTVRSIAHGANGNLWSAVRVAKDINPDAIPAHLTVGGVSVDPQEIAGAFGKYFSSKINSNVSNAKVNVGGVYNGKCKMIVQSRNFMTENDVKLCMSELKNK